MSSNEPTPSPQPDSPSAQPDSPSAQPASPSVPPTSALGPGARREPTRLVLAVVVVVAAVAAAVGMVLTWPSGDGPETGLVDPGVHYVGAQVVDSRMRSCDGTIEDVLPDGTVPPTVDCLEVTARTTGGREVDVLATSGVTSTDVPPGTRVLLERYPAQDGEPEVWAWHDMDRTLPLGTFALAFALVTTLVAGLRGLRALVGLALAFLVLGAYVLPALVAGHDGLGVALSGSTVIVVVVLYLAHGVSVRTTTALVGTLLGLAMVTGLGLLGAHAARLQPVTSEDTFALARALGADGVDVLRGVFLCGVVLAGIGVLNDVTITQASAVWELRAADPSASWRTLTARGMRIGRDHIASTVYTIAFAYAGASLPLLLLLELYDQPLLVTLTSGAFAEEIVRTLAGATGLVLAIPLTTVVAAVAAVGAPPNRSGHGHGHGHAH
ncbi:YibE/F family protein [Cellulomonas flavigena DSM 20109]|uniref:YibE/F family protein n=1 Tax=Cellulomonas flavigena (strain ATCC 482 / DSM 20109 / BCRC 11376 / JCM 18109 / NBRC 3775 / NCIMB 8073 / NRS 134) TaxID=446466 RepID=D5UG87_CELFN|nr:YibE/F family protein [Cellulomonas flavigena DSM 20109]